MPGRKGGDGVMTFERWRSELERELKINILGFWMNHARDDKHGGFVGEIRDDMTVVSDADKGLVLNARILWTFASAYRIYGEPVYLETADRAYEALERFDDPLHGGMYWMIDAKGAPTRDKKQVYGQAFAIYALAEYYRATGAAKALVRAEGLYRLLEKHLTIRCASATSKRSRGIGRRRTTCPSAAKT